MNDSDALKSMFNNKFEFTFRLQSMNFLTLISVTFRSHYPNDKESFPSFVASSAGRGLLTVRPHHPKDFVQDSLHSQRQNCKVNVIKLVETFKHKYIYLTKKKLKKIKHIVIINKW